MHVIARDVRVTETPNCTNVVLICINREEKRAYSQQDASAWLKGGYSAIFQGLFQMYSDVSAGSHKNTE